MKHRFFLILICLLFLTTRLYKINEIPPSLYWDEASIAYNAYSISQDGKDEWGEFLPIHFRAFGEFKLPVFIYTTAIFVKLFGLSELSVRFPAVLFSLGTILLIYALGKKISGKESIGLFSSFFLSISPWFFIFSRTGYEVTAGLFFYLLAIYLSFLIVKNKWFIFLSIVSFILSVYSYNSFRIITPLTILILIVTNFKNLLPVFRKALIPLTLSITLFLISLIPIYRLYAYDAGSFRLQAISDIGINSFKNYLVHFSPGFLFVKGDSNLRSQQANMGQLYLIDILFLPLGIIYILRKNMKHRLLILFLILIGPLPAAITKESPHALRAISTLPFLSLLSALGVAQLKNLLPKIRFWKSGTVAILLILFFNYLFNFMTTYPTISSKDWQYGYKRLFIDYRDQFAKYNKIIISDEYGQPYIFALFYLKFDPEKFRSTVVRSEISNWGFSTVSKFSNFEFGKVNALMQKGEISNSLVFASKEEKIINKKPVGEIKFLDGSTAFWVYQL